MFQFFLSRIMHSFGLAHVDGCGIGVWEGRSACDRIGKVITTSFLKGPISWVAVALLRLKVS